MKNELKRIHFILFQTILSKISNLGKKNISYVLPTRHYAVIEIFDSSVTNVRLQVQLDPNSSDLCL